MSFTVEITFSGLGLVILRSDTERSRQPNSVSFHMVDGRGEHAGHIHSPDAHNHNEMAAAVEHMEHVPRIWFRAEDLVRPEGLPFQFLNTAPEGSSVISEDLSGKTLKFSADGGSPESFEVNWLGDATVTAPRMGFQEEEDTLDWIPDLKAHVGLTSILEPAQEVAPPYVASIELPGGEIRSRGILRAPDPANLAGAGAFGKFRFGSQGDLRVIAEHVVWRRKGVDRFELEGLAGGVVLEFDGSFRSLQTTGDGEPVVSLALTNLPERAISGRFPEIRHLSMLSSLIPPTPEERVQVLLNPEREPADGFTSGSMACPPARFEIVVGSGA